MQRMTSAAHQLTAVLDLDTWRRRENLTWSAMADLVNAPDPEFPLVSGQTLRKYGLGMLWPEADLIERIGAVTGGEVTVAALHLKRVAWLKTSGRPRRVPVHVHE